MPTTIRRQDSGKMLCSFGVMWNPAKNKETLFIVISSFNFDGYLKIYFSFSGQRTVNIYEIQSDIFRITKYILWNKNKQEDQAFRTAMPICKTHRDDRLRERKGMWGGGVIWSQIYAATAKKYGFLY